MTISLDDLLFFYAYESVNAQSGDDDGDVEDTASSKPTIPDAPAKTTGEPRRATADKSIWASLKEFFQMRPKNQPSLRFYPCLRQELRKRSVPFATRPSWEDSVWWPLVADMCSAPAVSVWG